jgi:hypothetical protein
MQDDETFRDNERATYRRVSTWLGGLCWRNLRPTSRPTVRKLEWLRVVHGGGMTIGS